MVNKKFHKALFIQHAGHLLSSIKVFLFLIDLDSFMIPTKYLEVDFRTLKPLAY